MAKTSTASKRAWNGKHYDQIVLSVRKGDKEKIKAAADASGMSMTAFLVSLINSACPGLLSVLDGSVTEKKA